MMASELLLAWLFYRTSLSSMDLSSVYSQCELLFLLYYLFFFKGELTCIQGRGDDNVWSWKHLTCSLSHLLHHDQHRLGRGVWFFFLFIFDYFYFCYRSLDILSLRNAVCIGCAGGFETVLELPLRRVSVGGLRAFNVRCSCSSLLLTLSLASRSWSRRRSYGNWHSSW